MLIALLFALGFIAALAYRHADHRSGGKQAVIGVAALALGIRLAATMAVYLVARQAHTTGVWLNDEASFFLATESLLPDPLDRALPAGLDHLSGDCYLGLTTAISMAGGGVADANAFRVVNAALGAAVVVLSMLVARRMFGPRAALVSGLALAVWPTLVLWSATMLRDTLGSFALVAVWWTLGRAREAGWMRTLGATFLSLVILLSLRPYLGVSLALGVLAWAAYPPLRTLSRRGISLLAAGVALLMIVLLLTQARHIDSATHELFYRQTVTRIETLGRLYRDEPLATEDLPMKPGAPVAVADPRSGWLLGGVIQEFNGLDMVRVAFTDESIRVVPTRDVVLIQSANIPPLQLVAWVVPNLVSYLTGTSLTSESSSPIWVAAALAWDLLFALAIAAAVRARLSPREWLFPLCIVGGTVLALIAVPGAPGNGDRHSATQTLPLLLVLASGLVASRASLEPASGRVVRSMSTSPSSAATPAASRMRSAR